MKNLFDVFMVLAATAGLVIAVILTVDLVRKTKARRAFERRTAARRQKVQAGDFGPEDLFPSDRAKYKPGSPIKVLRRMPRRFGLHWIILLDELHPADDSKARIIVLGKRDSFWVTAGEHIPHTDLLYLTTYAVGDGSPPVFLIFQTI